jgi:cysteine synthase A
MIGVLFIAVMPLSTARSKIIQIKYYGGQCHFVDKPSQVRSESALLANKAGGYFMDQFTYAERATDWRGNNNIAEIIFQQMEQEPILSRTPSSCGLARAAPRLRSGDIFVIKPIQRNWWW